jgi:iron complex outermembrane receptor protein
MSSMSELIVQAYYDRSVRTTPVTGAQFALETLDFDLQHRLVLAPRVGFIWGVGYRDMADDTTALFTPASRDMSLASAFAQGDLALVPERLRLTLGAKLEHNDFSGTEAQPRIQLAWTPTQTRTLWTSVSRAVRSPGRLDRDVPPSRTDLGAETLTALELGVRWRPSASVALSGTLFWNDYDDLRSITINPTPPPAIGFSNDLTADTRGIEVSADVEIMPRWRMRAGFMHLDKEFETLSPAVHPLADDFEGLDPDSHARLHSMLDITESLSLDVTARYVDELPPPLAQVPSYVAVDVRLALRRRSWEAAIVGRNVNDSAHREFTSREIPRSAFATISWRF